MEGEQYRVFEFHTIPPISVGVAVERAETGLNAVADAIRAGNPGLTFVRVESFGEPYDTAVAATQAALVVAEKRGCKLLMFYGALPPKQGIRTTSSGVSAT